MTEATPPRTPTFGAFLLLNAVAAAWLAFSGLHAQQNSDSILSSLASRYAWTPFFWHQDRVGMFVPLLTSIVPDPVWNLVLQTAITAFAGLCLPLILAEVIYPHPVGRIAATLANAAMIAFSPTLIANNLLIECYYPVAMTLGCTGLLILGRGPGWPSWWRLPIAAVCFTVACWVYIGVPLWLGPLALARAWLQPGEPWPRSPWRAVFRPLLDARSFLGLALIVVAFAVNYRFMLHVQRANPWQRPTPRDGLDTSAWMESWEGFADHLHLLPGMATWEAALFGAALLGLLALLTLRRWPSYPIIPATVVLLIPAAAEFLFIGTREWPALNDHHPRYLLGTVESIQLVLLLIAVMPVASFAVGRARWWMFAVTAFALFGAAIERYGLPSPDRPRRELDARTGRWTEELLAADVDAFGGDYWTVWPTLYHVNMIRRERGDTRLLLGVSDRGRVLLERWDWNAQPALRVAVPKDHTERQGFLHGIEFCGLAFPEKIGEQGPFEIYSVHPLTPYR